MSIDTEHYKKILLAKQKELTEQVTSLDDQARESRSADVEDPIDEVTSAEGKAAAFGVSTTVAGTLMLVRDALQRIALGEFGECLDCGREIEPKRLDAVPWAAYCLEDQEKHDAENKQEPSMFESTI